MRKSITSLFIGILALGLSSGTVPAQDKVTGKQLDARAHDVNETAKKSGKMKMVLDRIATETGIPRNEVEAMHNRHAKVGPAGLLIAGVLADQTKKSPEQFLDKRDSGKTWESIAKDNRVSIDMLDERLSRLQRALTSGDDNVDRNKRRKD